MKWLSWIGVGLDLFIFGVAPIVVMQLKLLGEIGSYALVYDGNSFLRSWPRCRGEDPCINIKGMVFKGHVI